MKMKLIAGALAGVLFFGLCASPSQALTFHFSFNNPSSFDPLQSLVEGTISGLLDNAISAATSVQITSNPAGFGLGEYVGSPAVNEFTVSGGSITSAHFAYAGATNALPAVTCCTFRFVFDGETGTGIAFLVNDDNSLKTAIKLQRFPIEVTAIAETPLPAALPLFAGGLAALGLLGWRRKPKVQNSAA